MAGLKRIRCIVCGEPATHVTVYADGSESGPACLRCAERDAARLTEWESRRLENGREGA